MNIEQLLAAIAALQEAGTDEAVIKKMILTMLADDSGAAVSVPGGDPAMGMSNAPPEDQGAAPITQQPMQARNQMPGQPNRFANQRPAPAIAPQRQPAQPSQQNARPALPASQNARPAAYSQQGNNLGIFASLIGRAFGEAAQVTGQPANARPALPSSQNARPANSAPQVAAPQQQYSNEPAQTAPGGQMSPTEILLADTIFNVNEQAGLHVGQNSAFLKKMLYRDPALYAEAIADQTGVTPDRMSSPIANTQNRPLQNVSGGVEGHRQQLANQAHAYRNSELQAGRPCTYNEALTQVLNNRGPSR
jgi:hypothetical protein